MSISGNKRGGAREGAGRKGLNDGKTGSGKMLSSVLPDDVYNLLKEMAKTKKISMSALLRDILTEYVKGR